MSRTTAFTVFASLIVAAASRAGITYNYEYLYVDTDAGGFQVPGGTLDFVEHQYDDGLTVYPHEVNLAANTLTGNGGSSLDLSMSGDNQWVEATLNGLQAELTDTGYSKVFAQGHSYFQFWVMPRDKDYEYSVKVTQEYDEGLEPAYLSNGDRVFDLFTVLEGVGYATQREAGEWWFNGVLAAGNDYRWYGGVHAAAETEGELTGPFNARVRLDFSLLPTLDDYLWIGADGDVFSQSANWNPAGPPANDARAIFNSPDGADQTVSFDSEPQTGRLLVTAPVGQNTGDQLVFDLNGGTYELLREWNDVYGASVTVGDTAASTANLTLLNGTVSAKDTQIARSSGFGYLSVGQNGLLTAFNHFVNVGVQGYGSMNVADGGWVRHGHGCAGQYPSAQGYINVDGHDPVDDTVLSRWHVTGWFGLGDQGQGYLYVSNGAEAVIGKCDMAINSGSYGTAEISGNGSRWELNSGGEVSLIVGKSGFAYVTASSGGTILNQGEAHLAEFAGSTGSLILDGEARNSAGDAIPVFECNQRLTVGYGGVGDFELLADAGSIIRGAMVVGTDPAAAEDTHSGVTVDGAQSILEITGRDGEGSVIGMEIGRQGTGSSLSITNGGEVDVEYGASIGGHPDGHNSTLLVEGLDSLLIARFQLEVGRDGTGNVTVSNGGRIYVEGSNADSELSEGSKGLAFIGMRSTGTVTVTGANNDTPSTLESNAQLVVGADAGGNGTLNIEQGATVVSRVHVSPSGTAGIVGRDAGSIGKVTIKDGSRWEMSDGGLTVGWIGDGLLDVQGGHVSSTYGIIGRTSGAKGNVQIAGMDGLDPSHWDIAGSLAIGGDLDDNVGDTGHLSIGPDCWTWTSGGTTIYAPGTLSLAQGRLETTDLTLNGTIEGSGMVTGRVTSVAGTLHPTRVGTATSRELVLEQGCEQQTGATFQVELASDSDYSNIRTWNAAFGDSLAGTLKVSVVSGYVPPIDSTFDIAYAEGGINVAFDTVDLPTIQGEPAFELYLENPNTLRLRTIREYRTPADLDRDGDVDSIDLGLFGGCASGPAVPHDGSETCRRADFDKDNDVDVADFGRLQRCYSGEGTPANPNCAD